MTKNLKNQFSFLRDSSSPSASQNDNSASFCHSEESHRKANDEESKKQFFHFLEILPRLRRVRMTILLLSVILRSPADRQTTKNLKTNSTFSVILRRPPTAVDEESINNSFMLIEILHSASLHSE